MVGKATQVRKISELVVSFACSHLDVGADCLHFGERKAD